MRYTLSYKIHSNNGRGNVIVVLEKLYEQHVLDVSFLTQALHKAFELPQPCVSMKPQSWSIIPAFVQN